MIDSRLTRALAAALAVTALAAPELPADWLQFRGPQAKGGTIEGNGPDLSKDNVAWKATLPGEGLSSPVVVGDRVFLSASSGPRQDQLHVLAFSTKDGSVAWERRFWATGRTMHHKKTSVAAPSPVSDGEAIYVLYSSNDLVCLDLDGKVRWIRGLMIDYPNASNSLGLASSPVIAGGVLVVQVENDSQSVAMGIDRKTGREKWTLDQTKKANWSSPVAVPGAGGKKEYVILQGSKGLIAIDPESGNELWKYADGASTTSSSAVAPDGRVFSPSKGITALKPGAESVPAQLWRSPQLSPATPSPLYHEDRLYVVNGAGVLTAANPEDGEQHYKLRLDGKPFSASPVAIGNRLYMFGERGHGECVDLSAPEGKVIGKVELDEMILGTPALSDGALYVRSDKHLWRFGK